MESLSPQEPKPFSFPNGSLKKHQPRLPPPAAAAVSPPPDVVEYKECLKNHAAALGGHAVDGCGEFMPSPFSDPVVPSSLTCSACGCHRNFHRRHIHHQRHHPKSAPADANGDGDDDADDADDESSDEEDEGEGGAPCPRRSRSRSPPPYSSAPHMLLALSGSGVGGASAGDMAARSAPTAVAPPPLQSLSEQHRRRARTKFSPEQKARMHELSQKLGWRMPKRDDGSVEDFCRRIGVEKGVFKVWMHNNKQNLAGSSASAAVASATANTSTFSTRTLPATEAGSGDMNGIGEAGGESRFETKDSPSS